MTFFIEKGEKVRLDVYLTGETDFTRSYISKLVSCGNILLNGEKVKSGTLLRSGDIITLTEPPVITSIIAEDLPIDIIFEDDDIAVINKRQGMTVHPSPGNWSGTLVNALMYRLQNLSTINGEIRPGIVHRLDKDTSGVMVVAKNNGAHLNISSQIAERTVEKQYLGLVTGHLKQEKGEIDAPVGRSHRDRKLMAVVPDGRTALTGYEAVEALSGYDLVRFYLHTGRTHQIRVHSRHIGHPIVGDKAYGQPDNFGLVGQLLHSHSLTFNHPTSGDRVTFTAPLPDYFEKLLNRLRLLNK